MARSGIYKAEVLRARTKLLAQGIYPSIDIVRAELGNTGSKSTIHRYLKEIEEDEGKPAGSKVSISDALQDLVGSLAGRLHEEAESRITEASNTHRALLAQRDQQIAELGREAESFRIQLEQTQRSLAEEQAKQSSTETNLATEAVVNAKLAQQVKDLQERLASEEAHRQSLEEKHQHAREALEHFRTSTKEQREQEQRGHEHQVQYLQGEARALNQTLAEKQRELLLSHQDNTRLANELAHAISELHKMDSELRGLRPLKEQLASAQRQIEQQRGRIGELEASNNALATAKTTNDARAQQLSEQIRQLEIDLAAAKGAAQASGEITEKIRSYIALASHGELVESIDSALENEPRKKVGNKLVKT